MQKAAQEHEQRMRERERAERAEAWARQRAAGQRRLQRAVEEAADDVAAAEAELAHAQGKAGAAQPPVKQARQALEDSDDDDEETLAQRAQGHSHAAATAAKRKHGALIDDSDSDSDSDSGAKENGGKRAKGPGARRQVRVRGW